MKPEEDLRTVALGLFEKGSYGDCLASIRQYGQVHDPSLRILEALCLISLSKNDEAEVCLRDLRRIMPDSSEVCLYLGRVLEEKGSDEARAVFCEAVRLDPAGSAALRRYADYLITEGDDEAAYPIVESLWKTGDDPRDLSCYLLLLARTGRYTSILNLFSPDTVPARHKHVYLDALFHEGRFQDVVSLFEKRGEKEEGLFTYIMSLSKIDPLHAERICLERIRSNDCESAARGLFTLYLSQNLNKEAFGIYLSYLQNIADPALVLEGARACYLAGEKERAAALLSPLTARESASVDPELYRDLITLYHSILLSLYPDEGTKQLIDSLVVSGDTISLITAAELADGDGDDQRARDLFFKAFRSDLCLGGSAFVRYLDEHGDMHERKKILLYMIRTVRKVRDLELIADAVLSGEKDPDLLHSLAGRMKEVSHLLSTKGRTLYGRLMYHLSVVLRNQGNGQDGETACIEGLTVLPACAGKEADCLFHEMMACKRACFSLPAGRKTVPGEERKTRYPDHTEILQQVPDLDPAESLLLTYLARHRICTEAELRKVAGTARVAGLMNRIIRKLTMHGIRIIEKDGYGESGEVYRYAG